MWLTGGVYQQWADFLDRWAVGQAEATAALPAVDPATLTADTMSRLSARLSSALQARVDRWSAAFTADWQRARDDFDAARALTQARTGLRSLRALTAHPGLPLDVQKLLSDSIDRTISDLQTQLERGLDRQAAASLDRTAVERLRRVLRENALTAVLSEQRDAAAAAPFFSAASVGDRPRRQVLSD